MSAGYPPHLRARLIEIALMERGIEAALSELAEREGKKNNVTARRWRDALVREAVRFLVAEGARGPKGSSSSEARPKQSADLSTKGVVPDGLPRKLVPNSPWEDITLDLVKLNYQHNRIGTQLKRALHDGDDERVRELLREKNAFDRGEW